ncbi:MAG: transposase [Paracoccaceae bacterium]|jgi:transposase
MQSRCLGIVVALSIAMLFIYGYAVSEVAERLGISTKTLYTWKVRLSQPAKDVRIDTGQSREIRRLKAELTRVTEERDILKKATVR